jgi:hypothetical protein
MVRLIGSGSWDRCGFFVLGRARSNLLFAHERPFERFRNWLCVNRPGGAGAALPGVSPEARWAERSGIEVSGIGPIGLIGAVDAELLTLSTL